MNRLRHLPLILLAIVIVLILGERASRRGHIVPPRPIETQNYPKPETDEEPIRTGEEIPGLCVVHVPEGARWRQLPCEAMDPSFAGRRQFLQGADMIITKFHN